MFSEDEGEYMKGHDWAANVATTADRTVALLTLESRIPVKMRFCGIYAECSQGNVWRQCCRTTSRIEARSIALPLGRLSSKRLVFAVMRMFSCIHLAAPGIIWSAFDWKASL